MTGNENTWEAAVQQLVPTIICLITIIIQITKKMIYPRSVLDSNQSYHDTVLGATNSGLQSEGAAEVDPSPHGERVRHFSSLRSDLEAITSSDTSLRSDFANNLEAITSSDTLSQVCMRLELHGCERSNSLPSSYKAPKGEAFSPRLPLRCED